MTDTQFDQNINQIQNHTYHSRENHNNKEREKEKSRRTNLKTLSRQRIDEQNNRVRSRHIDQIKVKPIKNYTENLQNGKLTDYRGYNIPEMKQVYVQLLNDNLQHLIEYIYFNKDKQSYNSPSIRVALAMQMILASDQLIPYQLSSMIAKDIEDLRKDDEYIHQWDNPSLKKRALLKELEFLKKHTEIDETISLNLTDKPHDEEHNNSLKDFDINSGISTLNVSAKFPIENEEQVNQSCSMM